MTESSNELRALGRSPDLPFGVWDQPLGVSEPSDPFHIAPWAPFGDAFRSGDRRRQFAWILDHLVYADVAALPLDVKLGLVRVLEELVSAATRRRWAVERPAPMLIDGIGKRDPLAKRKRLRQPWRDLVEESRRGTRVFLTRPADPTAVLLAAKTAAREAIETVTAGGFFYLGAEERRDRPASKTLRADRWRPFLGRVNVIVHVTPPGGGLSEGVKETVYATLPDALVVAVLAMLHETPGSALGQCEYANGTPCERIFVKRGPQKWCAEHRRVVREGQLRDAYEKFQTKRARSRKGKHAPSSRKEHHRR